jgi:hypothetical protein
MLKNIKFIHVTSHNLMGFKFIIACDECFQFGVKKGHISKISCATRGDIIQLIPFVCAFYAFECFLFYSYHNGDDDVMVIPFVIGTRQNDLLEGALFILAHLKALHFITSHFPSYLFSSIADDIHIINPPSIVSFAYEHFHIELCVISFSIQL